MPRNLLNGHKRAECSSASSGTIANTIKRAALSAPSHASTRTGSNGSGRRESITERLTLRIAVDRSRQDHDALHQPPQMGSEDKDQAYAAGKWEQNPAEHVCNKLSEADIVVPEIETVNPKASHQNAE